MSQLMVRFDVNDKKQMDELLARSYRESEEARERVLALNVPAKKVLGRVGEDSGRLLVAKGQCSPYPTAGERVLVIALEAKTPRDASDAFMSSDEYETLLSALGARDGTGVGACDAMFATSWTYAWGTWAHGFELWSREKQLLVLQDGRLVIDAAIHRPGMVDLVEVQAVVGHLSDDWVKREVRLRLQDGRHVTVASQSEWLIYLDATYDYLCLVSDASWVWDLARTLGKALGKPVDLHEDLR